MRIRMLTVGLLLVCGSLTARAQDGAPSDNPPAVQAQTQSVTPKQSLERAPSGSQVEKLNEPTGGRFSFYRVDSGFLRFDSQTGQIGYCNSHDDKWACETVPENRGALEKQIEQLRAEIAGLKQQLKAQDEPPRPPQPIPPSPQAAPPVSPPAPGNSTALPGREEFARAAATLQDAWNRFVELVVGLKNEMLRKS